MGRATAELFAEDGANVIVTDRTLEDAQRVADAISQRGGPARAWALDVADPQAITATVQEAASFFGAIDIVVNNAEISGLLPIDDPDYDDHFHRLMTVLLTSHQRVVRAALPYLRRSDAARIVNIASTEALGATRHDSAYAAAKAGVTGLTRAMAVDLGPAGITVSCICPGPILTGMTEAISAEDRDVFARRRTALRRYGRPEEVAQITLSLCLPSASYITGTTIPVDGGLMARNA
ncbi:SDR family oxidoreductase [Novosphingobium sp. Gsoil 351]|nr:SDR family oxidoreductase [Novosphingobium sp. Gsoil 351]